MAIQFDNRLYTGGSERVDSRPHTALYAQLMAQKRAREDAFDGYIRNLNKNINSAGMRNQEREAFDEKLAAWQEYGMKNRDAIQKRTSGADIKFFNDYQDIVNLVNESKTAEERKKPFVQTWLDPNKRDRLNTQKALEAIESQDKPLYKKNESGQWERNPDFKPLNESSFDYAPKPFDQQKFNDLFKGIKRVEQKPEISLDPTTMTQTETKRAIFDQPAKDIIAQIGVTEYMQNPSFKEVVDQLDPEEYNDFFKKNYGHEIENKGDLAAAYSLKRQQEQQVTTKVSPDVFGRQKLLQQIRQADAKELVNLRHQLAKGDKEMEDVWIDSYLDDLGQRAESAEEKIKYTKRDGTEIIENIIPMDAVLSKSLEKQEVQPSELTITEDGMYRPIYYKYKDGERVKGKNGGYVVNEELSIPITKQQLKLSLGTKSVTGTQRTKEMSAKKGGSNPSKTIAGKDVPKGASVTQGKDGEFYYNGMKITK